MEVLLKLYNMTAEAADGSTIGRDVTEEYLAGEDYQTIIKDQLSLGGVTHKDRQSDEKYEKLIGPDDQILISNNVTHYIKKIYTTPNSDFCYAVVEILNPDDYAGQRRDNIMNLIADLKSGIKLPCSVVIQALWSYDNKCEKIIRIKGVDFTLNPSFDGAGIEKVFSSVMPDVPNTDVKTFSSNKNLDGCVLKTKRFSIEAEPIKSVKTYSLAEVANKYGRTSEVYFKAKSYSGDITDELLSSFMNDDIERPDDYFDDDEERTFSSVSSVRDRMYFNSYPRLVRINRILKAYKYYYDDKKSSLTDKQLLWLQVLLLQDINMLLKDVMDRLVSGSNLVTLYGLQQFGDKVKDAGLEFSKVYRQVLIAESTLGFVPEGRYNKWKAAYYEFIKAIVNYCFGIECTLPIKLISQL